MRTRRFASIRSQFFTGLALISVLFLGSAIAGGFALRGAQRSFDTLTDTTLPATFAAMGAAQTGAGIAAYIPLLADAEDRYDRQAAQVAIQQKLARFRQHLADIQTLPEYAHLSHQVIALADEIQAEVRIINSLVHQRLILLAGRETGPPGLAETEAELDRRVASTRALASRLTTFVYRIVLSRQDDTREHVAATRARTDLMGRLLWGMGAVGLLIVLPFFWLFVGWRVVRSLSALSRAARRLAEGDTTVPIPVPRHDEIGDLAVGLRLARDSMLTLKDSNARLRIREDELQRLAITDPLTGLANRRRFSTVAATELDRARRHGKPLSVLLIDIDRFKELNDQYGHAIGDQALIRTAAVLMGAVRTHDLVARFGGEEFVVLAPEETLEGAVLLGERLRGLVAEAGLLADGAAQDTAPDADGATAAEPLTVLRWTVSIGVATLAADDPSMDVPLNRADEALYAAKAAGRNCVESRT